MIKRVEQLKCLECGLINVGNPIAYDGSHCMRCGGRTIPLKVSGREECCKVNKKANNISIKVNVDTTEVDAALEKVRQLQEKTEAHKEVLILQANGLMTRSAIEKEESIMRESTGMKVCIINGCYEVAGVYNRLTNG